MKKYLLLILLALPALAFANSGAPTGLDAVNDAMMGFLTGTFGTALALTMLVMGFGVGVATNSPVPVITAVMGALFLHLAPVFIANRFGSEGVSTNGTHTAVQVVETSPRPAPIATLASAPQARLPESASQAQSVVAIHAASTPVVTRAQQAKPVQQVVNLKAASNTPTASTSTKTMPSTLVAHTVPVPAAVHPRVALKTPAVSTSQLTKWLGMGGAAIILSLLGLLAYMSIHRKTRAMTGFTGLTTSAPATSAFMDPHGFKREKRVPTFGHESV